jgi:catechol 2,3-dioxygenase-like lactoylglutathione lyase family enzyme
MEFAWKYTGVRVQDLPAALAFYRDGLGMRVRFQFKIKETGGRIVELVSGDGKHFLELNWYPPGSEHATPYEPGEALDHLAFRIKGGSLEEAIRHLEQHGGKLRIPPFKEGDCLLAYVDSPDGHTIELDAHGAAKRGAQPRAPKLSRAPAGRPRGAARRSPG